MPGGINSFLSSISRHGGLSSSNNFEVQIKMRDDATKFKEHIIGRLFGVDQGSGGMDEYFKFMCNEAQLPNVNAATGQINGLYVGIGANDYPHTRIFTEIALSFLLDADLTALKFFNAYHAFIFGDYWDYEDAPGSGVEGSDTFMDSASLRPANRVNRLEYANNYVCDIYITKTEQGPLHATQRKPLTYVLERAYPYSIDAVPLQFGPNQISSVNVNFKYERFYTVERSTGGINDDIGGLNVAYNQSIISSIKPPPPKVFNDIQNDIQNA